MNTAARPLKTIYTSHNTCINTVYLGTSQFISVYTRIKHCAKICIVSRFEPWISCTAQGCSDSSCINTVYLGTSQFISVYTRIKHCAKICIVSRFEPWISCTAQGCSDSYTTSVDIESVYHMIYVRLHIIVWLELSRLRPLRRP